MTEFLARVGDRINPIVVKETRQAVSSRLVAGFLLLFLGVQFVVIMLTIASREYSNPDDMNLRAGRDVFTFVQGILLGTCLILIPAMTGVRLAVERSDVNVDLLFISSLTPRAVISGKLFAAAALALLIFSACAPFMTFAYVMRGLDIPTIFVVLVSDYLIVLLATAFALFLASVPANRWFRIFLGVIGFSAMCLIGVRFLALSGEFLRYGGFDTASWEFWAGYAGIAALIVGFIGLLFVWSVALISPPAANRAYGVRVYTLGFWIAAAVGFGAWSLYLREPEVMAVWAALGCLLFALQIIISSCERDSWGSRVTRRIPRIAIFRIPAFLLYSGAAGGIFFGVIGSALTAIGLALWYTVVPTRFPNEVHPALVLVLIPGYAYCYCMTAIVFRRLLAQTAFRPGYTWILGLVLFGLGCVVPYVIRFALFDRYSRYNDEFIALYLPNPVVMIGDALSYRDTHVGLTIAFLVAWAIFATVVNVPWIIKQVVNFRPPDLEERKTHPYSSRGVSESEEGTDE